MRMLFTYVAVLLAATTARAEDDIGRVSYTGPMTKPQPKPDWVELASPVSAHNGTEFIPVGKDAGQFTKLRIDGTGIVYVDHVDIVFTNGKHKRVWPDHRLDAKQPSIAIELPASAIDTIVVATDPDTHGSYSVYAAPTTGGVALR